MNEVSSNPVFIALLCVARCLVPLLVLFGISYLLRRLGVVAKPTTPPAEYQNSEDDGI
jgi:hypothetical protein